MARSVARRRAAASPLECIRPHLSQLAAKRRGSRRRRGRLRTGSSRPACSDPNGGCGSDCRRRNPAGMPRISRAFACRGTKGSNPSPSSEESCEPRFLAILLRSRSGTDGSNPLPSSGESGANLSLSGIRLSTSRSRSFPRVCGLWEVARSAETGIRRRHRADRRQRLYWAKFQYCTADDVGGLIKPAVFDDWA